MNNNKRKTKQRFLKIILSVVFVSALCCDKVHSQFYAVGIDGVGLATTTFNIETSMVLTNRWSIHLPVLYNPFTYKGNRKIKQLTAQPGIRLWSGDSYSAGWFWGFNTILSRYNMGGFIGKYRWDGWAWGAGVSAGYSLPVHHRWNIEFEVGAGAVWTRYDKFLCEVCGEQVGHNETKWFVSPDKAAIKLIYLF